MNKPLDPRDPKDRQALDEMNRTRGTGAQQPPPEPSLPPKPEEPVATPPPKPKAPAKPPASLRSRYINLQLLKKQVAALGRVDLKLKLGSSEPDDLLGLWNMLQAVLGDLVTGNQCLIIAAKEPAAKPVEKKEKPEGS